MSRTPDQLAREVGDWIHFPRKGSKAEVLAALAELEAQAEAGQLWRDALAEDRGAVITAVYALDEAALERIMEAAQLIDAECQDAMQSPCTCRNFGPYEYRETDPRCPVHAAAAPSPADREEA